MLPTEGKPAAKPEWISAREFVRRMEEMGFSINPKSVYYMLRAGYVPHARLGRTVFIDWPGFLGVLARSTRRPASAGKEGDRGGS